MKKFLFLALVLFFQNIVLAQSKERNQYNYKVTYMLNYQPDSTDAESAKKEKMFLYVGDEFSKFSSAGKAIGDSLMLKSKNARKSPGAFARLMAQIPHSEFQYVIYKGIPKAKITFTEKIAMDNFGYVQDKNLFNWKILPQTDTLAGYPVQKATTDFAGRNYTAWFTSEIPISDGPYKFNGLPGLIVKIADDKNHYVFNLVEFQNLEKPIPSNFHEKEFIKTRKEKFVEIKENYEKDPFAAMERAGIRIQFEDGVKEQMDKEHREEMKKKNNPLELE